MSAASGVRVVLGPGTGLGEAFVDASGRVNATEGGWKAASARTGVERAFLEWLEARLGSRVAVEHTVAAPALARAYVRRRTEAFLAEKCILKLNILSIPVSSILRRTRSRSRWGPAPYPFYDPYSAAVAQQQSWDLCFFELFFRTDFLTSNVLKTNF